MSDAGSSGAVGAVPEFVPPGEITAGSMMRNAREAAGLHVAALAVSMKIPVKKLEALEADRLDLLHDAVFVRALAASVCRALKIDPAPILSKLPLNIVPRLNPDERGINAPFHSPSNAAGMAIPALLSKPSTLVVLGLVVAGIAVFFFPEIKVPDWAGELSSPSTKSSDAANQPQMGQPSMEMVEASSEPVASSTFSASSLPSARGTGNAVVALPPVAVASNVEVLPPGQTPANPTQLVVASQPVVAASRPVAVASRAMAPDSLPAVAASRPSSAPVLSSAGMVVFKAKGSTWVKVVDSKGIVLLSKTIVDGEVVGASGATPLSVVIGRVDATDVVVHGKPFTLTGVSKDNVARFEVK
nr:RodZ domain-containing protein [Rhodoferax sp.]